MFSELDEAGSNHSWLSDSPQPFCIDKYGRWIPLFQLNNGASGNSRGITHRHYYKYEEFRVDYAELGCYRTDIWCLDSSLVFCNEMMMICRLLVFRSVVNVFLWCIFDAINKK